ncbi:MAG: hypothetical protein ACK46A_04930 [Akkermansiaceae bacterium]|jgi:hypothetical protein|nr:hypothetical protein [Luteolibacter sp.]
MKNNIFILFIAMVLAAVIIVSATLVYLSKSSEYSRATSTPASISSESPTN